MVVLRPGSESSGSSSSSIFKSLRSRDVYVSYNPRRSRDANSCHNRSVGLNRTLRKKNEPDSAMKYVTEALNFYNQHSVEKYQLVKTGSVTPVRLPKCSVYHIVFTAKNTDVADAPKEKFFAELKSTPTNIGVYCVKHCVSLGPINSLSGDTLNGCQYCRDYKNVWHPPKAGGFVRGTDIIYKTLQDIFIGEIDGADEAKHLPMLEEVDDASPYATEVVKLVNQRRNKKFELVNPGFATRVILPTCSLVHVNFKAKETDGIAPEMLFFAELTVTSFSGVSSIKHWTVLNAVDIQLGNVAGDNSNGCYYCHKFNRVRHPFMGGYVRYVAVIHYTFLKKSSNAKKRHNSLELVHILLSFSTYIYSL